MASARPPPISRSCRSRVRSCPTTTPPATPASAITSRSSAARRPIRWQQRLRGVRGFRQHRHDCGRAGHRQGLRLSGGHPDAREPARERGLTLEGVHGGHGQQSAARERHLRASAHRCAGQDAAGRARRPVHDAAQSVRIFPRDHPYARLRAQRRQPDGAGRRPAQSPRPRRTTSSSRPICATTATMAARRALRRRRAGRHGVGRPVPAANSCRRSSPRRPSSAMACSSSPSMNPRSSKSTEPGSTAAQASRATPRTAATSSRARTFRPTRRGVIGSWERMNGPGIIGPGGGRIGAVLLSPYIRPGTVSTQAVQPLRAAAQRRGHLRPRLTWVSPRRRACSPSAPMSTRGRCGARPERARRKAAGRDRRRHGDPFRVEHVPQQVRAIADHAIHAPVDDAAHVGRVVDGPRDHAQAKAVRFLDLGRAEIKVIRATSCRRRWPGPAGAPSPRSQWTLRPPSQGEARGCRPAPYRRRPAGRSALRSRGSGSSSCDDAQHAPVEATGSVRAARRRGPGYHPARRGRRARARGSAPGCSGKSLASMLKRSSTGAQPRGQREEVRQARNALAVDGLLPREIPRRRRCRGGCVRRRSAASRA